MTAMVAVDEEPRAKQGGTGRYATRVFGSPLLLLLPPTKKMGMRWRCCAECLRREGGPSVPEFAKYRTFGELLELPCQLAD
jgi:hypothetical protein